MPFAGKGSWWKQHAGFRGLLVLLNWPANSGQFLYNLDPDTLELDPSSRRPLFLDPLYLDQTPAAEHLTLPTIYDMTGFSLGGRDQISLGPILAVGNARNASGQSVGAIFSMTTEGRVRPASVDDLLTSTYRELSPSAIMRFSSSEALVAGDATQRVYRYQPATRSGVIRASNTLVNFGLPSQGRARPILPLCMARMGGQTLMSVRDERVRPGRNPFRMALMGLNGNIRELRAFGTLANGFIGGMAEHQLIRWVVMNNPMKLMRYTYGSLIADPVGAKPGAMANGFNGSIPGTEWRFLRCGGLVSTDDL